MDRLVARIASACYGTVNAALQVCALLLWPRARPLDAKRVCVYRIGNLGDIVCALPAMQAVRRAYPDATLTLVSSPGDRARQGAADVVQGIGWIDDLRLYYADDIATVAGRLALLRDLRRRRFDVWIELPDDLATPWRQARNMLFVKLAGARWARGWRVSTLKWAGRAQSKHLRFADEVERTLGIVEGAGIDARGVDAALPRSPLARAKIEGLLRSSGSVRRPRIAIAPGATRSTNRWPEERFVALGERLSAAGCGVVLIGSRSEMQVAKAIAAQIGTGASSFAGQLSVLESSELLRHCDTAICLDSAVQHLAAAVGTPVISLFPAWQLRGKWHPHGRGNVVIRKDVPCDTCFRDACPNGNRCMTSIHVEEVAARVLAAFAPVAAEERSCASS